MKTQLTALLAAIFIAASYQASAQVAPAAYSDTQPDQITLSYVRTQDDYALNTGTKLIDTRLIGLGLEYAYRGYYPIEILGSVRYSSGQPLGQKIETAVAGIGYTRSLNGTLEGRLQQMYGHWYERVSPYITFQAGVARTRSNDLMYLYTKPKMGFTSILSAGLDMHPLRHVAIRPIYFEDQYLPFGVQGHTSTYWNFGAGIGYTFHWR